MATLALGVGGAALFGSFASAGGATVVGLGLTAAQVGFAVGSLAGSIVDAALFAPDTPSPKVPEQRVQGFAYGADIKQVLGTDRVAGTLLWVKGNRIDSGRTRRGRGGGGPFGKAAAPDNIERLITCRVGICKGPIDGVIAIWANGKPIYDVRADPTSGAPGVFRADGVDFTIYRGTGDEEPDPDEEADRGAGNTPGYRHWASIVFRNLPLGNSAQVPQFEFLVAAATGETEAGLQKTIFSGAIPSSQFGAGWSYDDVTHAVWLGTSELISGELVKINLYTDEIDATAEHVDLGTVISNPAATNNTVTYITGGPIINRGLRPCVYLLQKGLPGGADNDRIYEVDEVAVRTRAVFRSGLDSHDHGLVARAGETDYLLVWSRGEVVDAQLLVIDLTAGGVLVGRYIQDQPIEAAVMRGTDVYALLRRPEAAEYAVELFTLVPNADDPDAGLIRTKKRALYQDTVSDPPTALRYLPDEDIIIGQGGQGGELKFFDVSSGAPQILTTSDAIRLATYRDHQRQALQAGIHEGVLWLLQDDGVTVDKIDVVNRKRLDQFDLSALSITADEVCYEPRGNSLIVREGGTLKRVFLDRVSTSPVAVGTAITTIGAAAGLAAADFDVSALAGLEVDGLTLNAQAPARQWIAMLMRAFFLTATESGGKIVFRQLGDTVDKAVDADDLGAGEGRGSEFALQLNRLPDTELPALIEVSYRDVDESLEPAMQTAEHPVFTGSRRATIGIDAVIGRNRAKRLAVAFLYQAHLERERASFALPWSYLEVEPGDVLSVPHNGRALSLRLTRTRIGAVIECEAVPAVNLFDGTEAGAEPGLPDPGVTGLAETELFLFDVPLLRDGDRAFEEEGIYIGGAPSEPSLQWNGARITRSAGGSAQGEVARVFGDAAWGALITPPPDPAYPGWQDGALTLRLVAGDIASATLTDLLLSQANLALIASGNPATSGGWEAMQFLTATGEGGGVWRLHGRLLRGVRGTDPWMTHEVGDRIVIVSAADLERTGHTAAATFEYFAHTFGKQTPGFGRASDRETLKSRDHSRRCWAPRNVQGSRDGSNDLTLTWSRRARLGGQLTDSTGTPLIEGSEAYEVDVLDGPGGSVVRTIAGGITTGAATDPWSASVTYPAADQTTDGLTPGAPVTVKVYQIGAAGRGLAVEFTV